MATIWHDGALYRVSPLLWPSLTVKAMLWDAESTASPAATDVYVSDLVPASNELVNDDYARVALSGKASSLAGSVYSLEADTVSFGVLTPESLTQGVSGWTIYAQVTDDDDSILIASRTFTPVTLNGTEVSIPWPDGVVATVAAS